MIRRCAALALLFSIALAGGVRAADCPTPIARDDGWAVAVPQSMGLDGDVLCAMVDRLRNWPDANVHGVVVARSGKLVFERYFTGADEIWGRSQGEVKFDAETRHDLRSVSKSLTSLLVGLAIQRGKIAGVDESVMKFFPEHADLDTPERRRITLRHLLTMSMGVAWDETVPYSNPANSEIRMITAADGERFALEQPIVAPPGRVYNYSGGATALLGAVIRKTTGQPLDRFAREALLAPLGITDFEWLGVPGKPPAAASGARMRPRDMLKLGQVVLAKGQWNGREVVPAAWIAESTSGHITGAGIYFYGYQWWLGRSLVDRREVKWVAGFGWGGQRLFIVPEFDLVVATTAGMYRNPQQGAVIGEILNQYVLRAVK
ncbi:MAG: serine hydrolase [Alphaproteobacteria bacterium]|nr:serine hydrolase [Alphaproteobacteria bacterium]